LQVRGSKSLAYVGVDVKEAEASNEMISVRRLGLTVEPFMAKE
jgi:hypothetical protein